MDEREFMVLTDEEGNEVEVEIVNYFYYNGDEYAVLAEVGQDCNCPSPEECTCEPTEIFFMQVVEIEGDEENVEFVPVEDEELADTLFEIISSEMDEVDE